MPRDRKHVDVLIVGAGAAGLAAARDLSQAGLTVTIIEARPRVGGRILTLHDPRSPVPLELGAEFIHGASAETLPLAQAAGLSVLELPNTHERAAGGRFKPMGGFWELVDRMNHDLARRLTSRGKDFPVSEYLESASVPASRRGILRDFLQGFYAAHPERLSAQSLAVEAEGGEERDEVAGKQFRIANGGDTFELTGTVQHLVKSHGNETEPNPNKLNLKPPKIEVGQGNFLDEKVNIIALGTVKHTDPVANTDHFDAGVFSIEFKVAANGTPQPIRRDVGDGLTAWLIAQTKLAPTGREVYYKHQTEPDSAIRELGW